MTEIEIFNGLKRDNKYEELLRCCGSPLWVENMLKFVPFCDLDDLLDKANNTWWLLSNEDWKTAFAAHPKIGDAKSLKEKFSPSGWEGEEQSGTRNADEQVIQDLAHFNNVYEKKFGFIFLICATGKSALEMVTALKHRLDNDSFTEIQIAAGEQAKIIRLRLLKLLSSLDPMHSRL